MSIPDRFPPRSPRAMSMTVALTDGIAEVPPESKAVAPAPVARLAAPLAVVVLAVGIIAQVTHTGLFFLPALAAMVVAALRMWRE